MDIETCVNFEVAYYFVLICLKPLGTVSRSYTETVWHHVKKLDRNHWVDRLKPLGSMSGS